MSVEAMAAALKLQGLDPADKLLLVGIANHDGDGGAWPSVATLSVYLGKSKRTTQRRLAALEAAGWITRELNGGGTSNTPDDRRPTLYRLHLNGVSPGVTPSDRGVTPDVMPRGDRAVSPEPSSEPSSSEEPSTDQPTTEVPAPEWESLFESFWEKYPRKDSKFGAHAKFGEMYRRGDLEVCRHGFVKWRAHWRRDKTAKKYIPLPQTWLHQRRYLDDPADEHDGPIARAPITPSYGDEEYAL